MSSSPSPASESYMHYPRGNEFPRYVYKVRRRRTPHPIVYLQLFLTSDPGSSRPLPLTFLPPATATCFSRLTSDVSRFSCYCHYSLNIEYREIEYWNNQGLSFRLIDLASTVFILHSSIFNLQFPLAPDPQNPCSSFFSLGFPQ